jgi:hypothetical protein
MQPTTASAGTSLTQRGRRWAAWQHWQQHTSGAATPAGDAVTQICWMLGRVLLPAPVVPSSTQQQLQQVVRSRSEGSWKQVQAGAAACSAAAAAAVSSGCGNDSWQADGASLRGLQPVRAVLSALLGHNRNSSCSRWLSSSGAHVGNERWWCSAGALVAVIERVRLQKLGRLHCTTTAKLPTYAPLLKRQHSACWCYNMLICITRAVCSRSCPLCVRAY